MAHHIPQAISNLFDFRPVPLQDHRNVVYDFLTALDSKDLHASSIPRDAKQKRKTRLGFSKDFSNNRSMFISCWIVRGRGDCFGALLLVKAEGDVIMGQRHGNPRDRVFLSDCGACSEHEQGIIFWVFCPCCL